MVLKEGTVADVENGRRFERPHPVADVPRDVPGMVGANAAKLPASAEMKASQSSGQAAADTNTDDRVNEAFAAIDPWPG
jgi:hypothetical protein